MMRRIGNGVRPAASGRARAWVAALAAAAFGVLAWPAVPSGGPAAQAAAAPADTTAGALTVEAIFGRPSLVGSLPHGVRWRGDSKGVTLFEDIDLDGESHRAFVMRRVPSGRREILCVPDTATVPEDLRGDDGTRRMRIGLYRWDRQGRRIVFPFADELFTFDARTKRFDRLTHAEGRERDPDFSPDGRRVAFSRDHDLFVVDVESHEEVRLTSTGSDSVLNGILDWVYMEELFTRGNVKAFWWSPDSKRLAFLEIRESPVPVFPLVDWSEVHGSYELQHYPKAGDPNPLVRVGIVSADGGDIVWADVDTSDDSYIARVYWLGDGSGVAIEKLNRAQDRLTLLFADARTGAVERVFDETHDTWVNVNYLKHYYRKRRRFLWGSERDGHQHLYLFGMNGEAIRQLTKGPWEVTALEGVDEKRRRVYFTANRDDVRERQLYVVSEKGGRIRRITKEPGTHSVTLSPDFRWYIDRWSTASRPTRMTVCSIDGRERFELGDSRTEALSRMNPPAPEFFTIERDGRTYQCMITRPPDFDPARRYPVIVYVYGGPHAQVVRNAWSRHGLWHAMMAQRGYVVFSLDNRGSWGRGKAWEDAVLRHLGVHELEDQLVGVDWLRAQPWVDGDRIGIWGWSYGGYMTLVALTRAPDVFRAGVAVAPVTDWRFYDSIYTERYMKRPVDNPEGYEDSAPLNFAADMKGRLLLMHGTADDNVHMQNSIRMVRELIDAGKDFDFMLYPGRYHGIHGTADRVFLYRKMTEFFDRWLRDAP